MGRGKDGERFTALYELTNERIAAYALRRCTTPEDAADLVAETYLVAWRRIDVVPSGHDGLLFLYVTARQLLSNQSRRVQRDDALIVRLADELRTARHDPHDEAALTALERLMALPGDLRELLMLAGWEGLNARDLGRVLGCSATAARIRLHRARARLQAESTARDALAKREPAWRHEHGGDASTRCVPGEA